jgi:hypothetical protein
MSVFLNVRVDLKRETKDKIKELARKDKITIGELFNRHFK